MESWRWKARGSIAAFTESEVEEAALEWLEALGWQVAHGPEIAPDASSSERADYGAVAVERRLRDALDRLNPGLPADALDDAFRKLTRPEGATLETRNRAFHRLLVDGVTVEYRVGGGALQGAQVAVVDYEDPIQNGWLSTSSPSSRASTSAGRTSCCSSTAFRLV